MIFSFIEKIFARPGQRSIFINRHTEGSLARVNEKNNKRRFPYEIVVAIGINVILLTVIFTLPGEEQKAHPLSVKVDISNFSPPKPEIMANIPKEELKTKASDVSEAVEATSKSSTEQLAEGAMRDFTPDFQSTGNLEQSVTKKRTALDNIQNDMDFFQGLNDLSAKGGRDSGGLPPGHRIGESFQSRLDKAGRPGLLRRYGGGKETEDAVDKALKYLASIQNKNGSWGSPDSFKTGDAAALSSLALLAFLAHGENCNSEQYGKVVTKGTEFLTELANTENIEYAGKSFGHAILTYALAEAYALSGSMSLERILKQRIRLIIQRQNGFGSFNINYDNTPQAAPSGTETESSERGKSKKREKEQLEVDQQIIVGEPACDLSLLAWHIQALAAAKNAGLQLEGLDKCLDLATEALIKIHQGKDGGFSQGINMKRFVSSDNMNPVGLLALQLLGSGSSAPARNTEKLLKKTQSPRWKNSAQFPLYRWYYQTQALFQAEKGRGRDWKEWNENLKRELTSSQQPDGAWGTPGGDKSFRLKNPGDLTIYSSSLCALMLQVYYRYLPGYSIAESSELKSGHADELDLGLKGLITRLPGGADPMAAVILGVGPVDMDPVFFGKFNGAPDLVKSPQVTDEFKIYASFSSTLSVRRVEDWPQTLQPNQRIAMFFDELLPENFKGHLQLSMAIITNHNIRNQTDDSIEVVLNGKRLYNSIIPCEKQLVNVLIPSDYMQSFNNILQIRNNGSGTIAFDGAKLSAITKLGRRIYLATENVGELPEDIQHCFNAGIVYAGADLNKLRSDYTRTRIAGAETLFRIDKNIHVEKLREIIKQYGQKVKLWEFICKDQKLLEKQLEELKTLCPEAEVIIRNGTAEQVGSSFSVSGIIETRQALPAISLLKNYDLHTPYWGSWSCDASERMGNEFMRHYLCSSGRNIVEWLAGGGSSVILKNVYGGGMFYDRIFKTELPPTSALRQASMLFAGTPRQLPASIFPKTGDKPAFATSVAAAYNYPGVATIVVGRRFAIPTETEVLAIVPWDGATEMIMEKGFMSKNSPFCNFAAGLERSTTQVNIENHTFKYSAVLPEMTVIRLIRKGSKLPEERRSIKKYVPPLIDFDYTSAKISTPDSLINRKKYRFVRLRHGNGFATSLGDNGSFRCIPATVEESFKPHEAHSTEVSFNVNKPVKDRHDSIYLSCGQACDNPQYLNFYVYSRISSKLKRDMTMSVPLRFIFSGKCFKVNIQVNRWQQVYVKLDDNIPAPDWQFIRILQPEYLSGSQITAVNYEINDVSLLTSPPLSPPEIKTKKSANSVEDRKSDKKTPLIVRVKNTAKNNKKVKL